MGRVMAEAARGARIGSFRHFGIVLLAQIRADGLHMTDACYAGLPHRLATMHSRVWRSHNHPAKISSRNTAASAGTGRIWRAVPIERPLDPRRFGSPEQAGTAHDNCADAAERRGCSIPTPRHMMPARHIGMTLAQVNLHFYWDFPIPNIS
jgi:hypothetical protein